MRLPPLRVLLLMIIMAGIVLSIAWLAMPYRLSRSHGDGTITDGGFWSYPRYRIHLPSAELTASRTLRYTLEGLPPERLTLALKVVEPSDRNVLRGMKTVVSIRIADIHDNTVCSASGPLKDWVLSESLASAEYWHPNCRDVRFHTGMSYTMTITVSGENSNATKLVIVPTLSGGGNELP